MGRKEIKMPCSEYEGKQRKLCFATDKFTDFSRIRKKNTQLNSRKDDLDGIGIIGPTSNSIGASLFV